MRKNEIQLSATPIDAPMNYAAPKKANDCFTAPRQFSLPGNLFDEFWHEGELALLHGPPGIGKSILATQVAEAIARGRGLEGFRMPVGRRRVLYVDMTLSDGQWQARYSHREPDKIYCSTYRFSERLYRGCPPATDELLNWLRVVVPQNGYEVVVIDDISVFKRSNDGTMHTLPLMRELRSLRDELGISILVLADSFENRSRSAVSDAGLGRSRVLCGVADSVFAMARSGEGAFIVQTRTRNSRIIWTERNAPVGVIKRLESGLLGFEFDARFGPQTDEQTRSLIRRAYTLSGNQWNHRQIAEELGISKNKVGTLLKKWTPAIGTESDAVTAAAVTQAQAHDTSSPALNTGHAIQEVELDEWDEAGFEKPVWLDEERGTELSEPGSATAFESDPPGVAGGLSAMENTEEPEHSEHTLAAPESPFAGMEHTTDDHGTEIWIEERASDGKPSLWYQYRSDGVLLKRVRDTLGTTATVADPGRFGRFAKIDPPPKRPKPVAPRRVIKAMGF